MELLAIFDEALQLEREEGNATLERGDCVIMDHCGFHHARFMEPILRNMFADCGITLLFQPPYFPNFNTCEFCFCQIKDYLRRYQLFAEHETKIAIAYKRDKINHKNFGIIAFNWDFWNWSKTSGSFQSWLSGHSGTLLLKALCKIRRSRSSCIRLPVPHLSKFCAFNLGRITAKNDVLARSRALSKWLMFSSSSAASLLSDLTSHWSSLTFIFCSGRLSFILHESIFEQGGLRHWSTYGPRYCQWYIGQLSVIYRSTVGQVSVDTRSILGRYSINFLA